MLQRILLVEDESDILHVFRKGLEGRFLVDAFSDPEQALNHFKQHPNDYDLVLTDVRMPKLSGFELASEIHKIRKDIAILFMSAFEIIPDEYKHIFPAVADSSYFISKPVSLSKLEKIIAEHVKFRK